MTQHSASLDEATSPDRAAAPAQPQSEDPVDSTAWQLRRTDLAPHDESLFALANGSLGVRGGLEETPGGGCFLAGVYERNPIDYHERFPGFARSTDTRVPVADGKRISLLLDGAELDLAACDRLEFERVLDLRRGVLRRRLKLRTPQGATLLLESERFVAWDRNLLAIRYRVTSLDWTGTLGLVSAIEAGQRGVAQGDDPRIGVSAGLGLETLSCIGDERIALLTQRTRRNDVLVCCAQTHRLDSEEAPAFVATAIGEDRVAQQFEAGLRPGRRVSLEKFVAYGSSAGAVPEPLGHDTTELLSSAQRAGYQALEAQHAQALEAFWADACIDVDGDPDSALALRFNLFHLLQSAGRSGLHGTAAKGLTGEGYEGHCFWDTEVFVLPVMVFTAPTVARAMLEYRYRTLDAAREHAREMNHAHGALYPWRTIAGGECSGHYPTGSAAYHINAAVAYAIGLYLDATDDAGFLPQAAEMLFETARVWMQVGHFDPLRGGAFGVHGVTGPDEYSVLVDNNFYTNRMAQRHLLRAAAVWQRLAAEQPAALRELCERLQLGEEEPDAWLRAAQAMQLRVHPELEIFQQDDTFLHKPRWPDAIDGESKRPLLLDYHPLTLYRHQICKQADVVMALVLAGDGLDAGRKRRSFDYYEAVTTHDSTLSPAIYGILAGEVGQAGKAWRYFDQALRIDLDDLHGNTSHGVHMAAMAGSWLGLAWGFAGLRVVEGTLHFAPILPAGWRGYRLGLHWRGRQLQVEVDGGGARYTLLHGAPLEIVHAGGHLVLSAPAARIGRDGVPFPRRCRALVFDLDGVLTDTARMHYLSWKRLADEIGVPFDETVNRRLKGIDRMASLEVLLERSPRRYGDAEKQALAERKNGYYVEAIARFTPDDLFPGARAALQDARRLGLRVALASASRNAGLLLRLLDISDAFDVVVDAARITRPKPAPDIFLAAAAALGVEPDECIGIEDAAAGVAAIKAAGMTAIGIGAADELSGADAIVPSIEAFQAERFARPG